MYEVLNVTKALAEENRLRVICALRGRELCVCQIIELLGLAPSTVSKHLSILHHARLVEIRKEGRWCYYRLAGGSAPKSARSALMWVFNSLSEESRIQKDAKAIARIMKCDPSELGRIQLDKQKQESALK